MIFEWIQDKFELSVFDLKYNLFVLLTFITAVGLFSYISYLSWMNFDEDLKGHDDNTFGVIIHEAFLVLRFICVGFVIMLTISFIGFTIFLISEGLMHDEPLEDREEN